MREVFDPLKTPISVVVLKFIALSAHTFHELYLPVIAIRVICVLALVTVS